MRVYGVWLLRGFRECLVRILSLESSVVVYSCANHAMYRMAEVIAVEAGCLYAPRSDQT